jgi:hypothetical protein
LLINYQYFPAISEEGFYEMSQMHSQREHEHEQDDQEKMSDGGSPEITRYIAPDRDESAARLQAVSTISAPEVSLVPSPGLYCLLSTQAKYKSNR